MEHLKILLKGGHLNEPDLCDILYDKNDIFEFYSKKLIPTILMEQVVLFHLLLQQIYQRFIVI